MPGDITIKPISSIMTFQDFNGDNYTIAGNEVSFKKDNLSFGCFAGMGTDFKSSDFVGDLKFSHKYSENLSQNLRIRTKLNEDRQSVQIRYSPITVNVPLGKGVEAYANLNYKGLYKSDGSWENSAGIFAGVDIPISKKARLSIEAERYNLQDITDNSGKNYSANAILKFNF